MIRRAEHQLRRAAVRVGFVLALALPAGSASTDPGEWDLLLDDAPVAPVVAEASRPAGLRLVVALARHGVRTPLPAQPPMALFAADPWPTWPDLAPGDLTTHGYDASVRLGAWLRRHYARLGLLPEVGCPHEDAIHLHADREERDLFTAKALLDGLAPRCGLPVHRVTGSVDGLFHPQRAGLCGLDGAFAAESVRAANGGLVATRAALAGPIEAMQRVLRCCDAAACRAEGVAGPCTLAELPDRVDAEGRLQGAIAVASTAAEDLLLQYADGLPPEKVGWGRVDEALLMELLRIHVADFALVYRPPALARRRASNLAAQVLASLEQAAFEERVVGALPTPGARLVVFVGHDEDLAGLGGLLGLDWHAPPWPRNATPPGGALVFELWRDAAAGAHRVVTRFLAQTPRQLRLAAELGPSDPPAQAELAVPGCPAGDAAACRLDGFAARVMEVADRGCVAGPLSRLAPVAPAMDAADAAAEAPAMDAADGAEAPAAGAAAR